MSEDVLDLVDCLTRSRISEAGRWARENVKRGRVDGARFWAATAAHEARQALPQLFIWDEKTPYGHQLSIEDVA